MQAFNKLEICLLRKMFPFKIPFFETPGVYIFFYALQLLKPLK